MTDEQRWHLAGTAPEIYAEHLVPAVFAPWARVLLDAAAVGIGHTVLDVACGTGVAEAALIAHVQARTAAVSHRSRGGVGRVLKSRVLQRAPK